jgi:hypothetical protein
MSGGGGGVIIIRSAIKTVLSDPLVHGALPTHMQTDIGPILPKDVNDWSAQEASIMTFAFIWAAAHC